MAEIKIVQCKKCKSVTRFNGSSGNCIWCGENVQYIEGMMAYSDSGRCEKCGTRIDGVCSDCNSNTYVKRPSDLKAREILIGPYITWDQFNRDIIDFSDSLKGKGYDAVIGVPRSGLVVATQMSIRMGLPLYSIGEYGPIYLGGGLRVRKRVFESIPRKALLVEDSTVSGTSVSEAVRWMGDEMESWDVSIAAVYATPGQIKNIDEYHRELELPHWFEWHLMWSSYLMEQLKVGVDFDGILCPDFTAEQDDDGWRYLDAMKKAKCLVPQGTYIHAIITARLEKYRPWTEEWLNRFGISYKHLIMGQWASKAERESACIGSYKAEYINKLGCRLFIESCPHQSIVIKDKIQYGVLCPALGGSIAK